MEAGNVDHVSGSSGNKIEGYSNETGMESVLEALRTSDEQKESISAKIEEIGHDLKSLGIQIAEENLGSDPDIQNKGEQINLRL
jgi:hypothetical protein